MENKRCFCGCDTFHVTKWKGGKQWQLTCESCKCERHIDSPDVSVPEYRVSPPFAENKGEEK